MLVSTHAPCRPWCPLLDVDLWVHRHPWTEPVVAVLAGVEIDANGNALDDFYVIARRVLWWQDAEPGPAGSADRDDLPRVCPPIGIDGHPDALAWFHVTELGFLEVGRDPDVVKRHHRHQLLAGGDVLTKFHG